MDGKEKKGKGKESHSKLESGKVGKKRYLSKVKCFNCHEHGHYAKKFPQKNNNKKASGGAASEALDSQFVLYFTLIACMASSVMGSMWYLDSGASFHRANNK